MDAYASSRIDDLPQIWDGFGKLVRAGLGITAFGVNVMDVPASYYLQTVETFFQRHDLTQGRMQVRGAPVIPAAIERTALMTVEGELDDISAPGQTIAAQALCSGIPADRRAQYLQVGVGHYGIFNGRKWRSDILPRIKAFIDAS